MAPSPTTHEDYDDEEEEFDDDEEDDDDDEVDFDPEKDADDDDDEEPTELLQVHGTLRLNQAGHLVYSDEEENGLLHLVSTEPLAVDLYEHASGDSQSTPPSSFEPLSVTMIGTLQLEPMTDAPTPQRKILMSLVVDQETHDILTPGVSHDSRKSTGEEEEEDDTDLKKAARSVDAPTRENDSQHSHRYYKIFGREVDVDKENPSAAAGSARALDRMELRGAFRVLAPSWRGPVDLVCDARTVSAARTTATGPPTPTVAAARARPHGTNDEEDDEDAEADEEVDYDELIALHEEAGLPVEQLRKRLAEQQGADRNDRTKRVRRSAEDEDDEYDGF